ncbi:GNAT family N-acetyltransferase [candidate division KSB1 bacterium]
MDELKITAMLEADRQDLAGILAEGEFWQRKGHGYDEALAFLEGYDPGTGEITVARMDGKSVGWVWFTSAGTFYEFGYVYLLAVAADYRGRGIGEELMRVAEGRIGKKSPAVFLLVSDFNEGARRFYGRIGYSQCGTLPNYKGGGNDEIIMWKTQWKI